MTTWEDYKKAIRTEDPEISKDLDEVEAQARIISVMIAQRHYLHLSQRELAEMCGIPHSSVARIESGKSSPKLSTLLKIFDKLDLALTVQRNNSKAKRYKQI